MFLDRLNNSHLLLLVLLTTIIVSTATSVSVLSIVHERLQSGATGPQPTIVQQTINRIIERDTEPPIYQQPAPPPEIITPEPNEEGERAVLLAKLEKASVQIYNGSSRAGFGMFISPDGTLLSSALLRENRRYNVRAGEAVTYFSVTGDDGTYSLLTPAGEHTPEAHTPLFTGEPPSLGTDVLLFGSFGDNPRLYRETVTERGDGTLRTSAPSDATRPLGLVIDGNLAGFLHNEAPWIPLPDLETLLTPSPEEGTP